MPTLAGILVLAGFLAYARNGVWTSDTALWEDAVSKSPEKSRPQFQLAFAYYAQGRCQAALPHYEAAGIRGQDDYRLMVDWALVYDCLGRPAEALAKLRQAMALKRTAQVYSLIGMVDVKDGKYTEARQALDTAVDIDPNFSMTYTYLAALYDRQGDTQAAIREFRRALAIDPTSEAALEGLSTIQRRLGQGR